MNPVTKRLLEKKGKLSGKDIGRLLIANLIDIYNGEGLQGERIWALMQSVKTEKDSIDYELYRRVFYALDETRDLCAEKMKQAHLACTGLQIFNEAVFFANSAYPDCQWKKYKLGKMTLKTRDTGVELWTKLRNGIQAILATGGAFKAAGAWLRIPKLETILPSDKKLRLQVDELNNFNIHAITELNKKNLPTKIFAEAHEIFMPMDFDLGQPTKEDIAKAKKTFTITKFAYDLDDAIAMMNPYFEF